MRTSLSMTAVLAGLALAHLSQAQTNPAPEAAKPAEGTEGKVAVTKGKDTLSVDFPDEEIRNVLRNVADLFELNLVIPDTLQGKTSIKLRDVTWRQIFDVVLKPVGYTYIEDGNIIKVVTADSLNLEPLATEVFILNYAKASEVKPSVDALVDSKLGGKIVVDARSNALVVTERPSAIQRIRPIIQNLDRATDQVMIESKFIEVTNSDVKNVGVNWSALNGYKLGVGGINRSWSENDGRDFNNRHGQQNIDVPFMNDGYERADDLAARNILPPNTNPNRGIGPAQDPDTGEFKNLGPTSDFNSIATSAVARVTSAVFSADDFGLIISALKSLNDTKLVSNPTVVTLNNTEASINVGQEYPVPSYTYNQERGSFEVSGFAYKPIGIILKVTPQVNAAGFIKLTVEPEISNVIDKVSFGGAGGASVPVVGVRKTKTQVTLRDGFTLGIGGLVDTSTIKGETKVPVLGSIPGLGRLFRSDSSDKKETNLLIFITARTIKPDGATVGEIFDSRVVRKMAIGKDELPGYRDGSDPFYQPPPPEPAKKK